MSVRGVFPGSLSPGLSPFLAPSARGTGTLGGPCALRWSSGPGASSG